MIQGCKNPIAEGDFKWIFAWNCEGTEQLQLFLEILIQKTGLDTAVILVLSARV